MLVVELNSQRRLMSAHVREGIEAHLSLLACKVPEFIEDKIKQQGDQMKEMMEQNRMLLKLWERTMIDL